MKKSERKLKKRLASERLKASWEELNLREGAADAIALLATMLIPVAPIVVLAWLAAEAMKHNVILGGFLLALELLTIALSVVYAYALSEDVFENVRRRLKRR